MTDIKFKYVKYHSVKGHLTKDLSGVAKTLCGKTVSIHVYYVNEERPYKECEECVTIRDISESHL